MDPTYHSSYHNSMYRNSPHIYKALRKLEKVGKNIEHLTISELKKYKRAVYELINSKLDAALINEPFGKSIRNQLIEWDVDKKYRELIYDLYLIISSDDEPDDDWEFHILFQTKLSEIEEIFFEYTEGGKTYYGLEVHLLNKNIQSNDIKHDPYLYPFVSKLWELCFAQAKILGWDIKDNKFPY